MTVLSEIIAACDPALRDHAVSTPRPGRFEHSFESPDRAFVFEAVYEAYLMHYGTPRIFADVDADMRLLAGDSLYALAVSRLAETGDLDAVEELAHLIANCATAEAEGRSELIDELWNASLRYLAAGVSTQAHSAGSTGNGTAASP